jgi:hypothetical protein
VTGISRPPRRSNGLCARRGGPPFPVAQPVMQFRRDKMVGTLVGTAESSLRKSRGWMPYLLQSSAGSGLDVRCTTLDARGKVSSMVAHVPKDELCRRYGFGADRVEYSHLLRRDDDAQVQHGQDDAVPPRQDGRDCP